MFVFLESRGCRYLPRACGGSGIQTGPKSGDDDEDDEDVDDDDDDDDDDVDVDDDEPGCNYLWTRSLGISLMIVLFTVCW